MPASNKPTTAKATKAATASAVGRGTAKELSGRAAKRAAPSVAKSTPAPVKARAQRGAPQAPETYSASGWGAEVQFELTTPSGKKCLAHELSIERLIEMGLLETINSLSGIIESEVLPQASGQPQVDMKKMMANGEQLVGVLGLVNVIICEAVDAPVVHPVPEAGEARVVGNVYVDSIPLTDRFFLFNEVTGGLDSLAAFRAGSE